MSTDVTTLTTFRTQARADDVIELTDVSQLATLKEQLDRKKSRDFLIIGSGSNILFADDYHGTVIVNRLEGIEVIEENEDNVTVKVAAGEIWHDLVCELSARGFYGLENLALIPGTMGAAPVQNIGAYGVEVATFIKMVEAFDLQDNTPVIFDAESCEFGYRESLFKRPESRQRFLITAVTLTLSKQFTPILSYQGLYRNEDEELTPKGLLERVISVRQNKLPDPDKLPNAGSFFKNAIVPIAVLSDIQKEFPDVPFFSTNDDQLFKIPTAWLIETVGFKGVEKDNGAGVYEKHALILVNRGSAHGREVFELATEIIHAVKIRFGVDIVPEVRVIK